MPSELASVVETLLGHIIVSVAIVKELLPVVVPLLGWALAGFFCAGRWLCVH